MSPSVGERLKSAREAKRLSLEEACGITKIQRQTLEAIEQDRVQESLDPVYARIFVKKYAAFLGLDAVAMANEYPGLARGTETAVQTATPPVEMQAHVAAPPVNWMVPAGVAVAALVGIAFLGYMAVDLFHNLRQQRPPQAAQAQISSAPEPRPKLIVPASKPLKLTIQTTADVWLQLKSDGDIIFQSVLTKGSRESWTAKRELELWTGNAGAMQLFLNGKPLEWAERGVRKGVKITHAGVRG